MIKQGLTFIELLVVLFLISLIATFSVRLIPINYASYVRAELEKLYGSALYLQAQAYKEQKPHILTVHFLANNYSVDSSMHTLHPAVKFGFQEGTCGPPSQPLRPLKGAITFKDASITFYPDGTISSGAIYLTDVHQSCTYALTSGITQIPYIRKYKYSKKWELLN